MTSPAGDHRILILDCGSQFTQLIARRVREARVYCEIHPPTRSLAWIREWKPSGIILSGGPSSVTDEGAPTFDKEILGVGPILGVCYGMQWIAMTAGSVVAAGATVVRDVPDHDSVKGLPAKSFRPNHFTN